MRQGRGGAKKSPKVLIRKFCMEDYDSLMSIWAEVRLPHKPQGRDRRDKIEREIKRPNAIFLVAEIEGKLVGSVFATHDGRKGWINRLVVSPAFRRRGIAKKLVKEAENRLSEKEIDIVACLIEDWNAGSKKFFENIGYNRFDDISYFTKRRYPGA